MSYQTDNESCDNSMETDSFITENKRRHKCNECDKYFYSKHNLRRHEKRFHPEDEESVGSENHSEEDDSSDERSIGSENLSKEDYSSDERSIGSENLSEEDVITDKESTGSEKSSSSSDEEVDELDDEYDDVFDDLIYAALSRFANNRETMEDHHQLSNLYKKSLRKTFTSYIHGMLDKQAHPLFKAIIKSMEKYEKRGFNNDEAIEAAVSFWKHPINSLIDRFLEKNLDE